MARLVKHERQQPYVIDREELDSKVAICGCGLSDDKPYCDGSHSSTQDEEEDEVYVYDENDEPLALPREY